MISVPIWLENFWLAFIPLFIAMDPVAVIPAFINLTADARASEKRKLLWTSCITAFVVALLFVICGQYLFKILGISANDFRIGGGVVLLVIAITDLAFSQQEERRAPLHERAVVPIAIPLIIGPAALTTLLMLVDRFGYVMCLVTLVANIIVVWIVFKNAEHIVKLMGKGGTIAFGKVASLFMVAIAIMFIRVGIKNLIDGHY